MIVLGETIKELRRRDGRTQEALAVELGVTAQAVSRWEKGICCPDIELIPSIANYFGVSIDELFGYDNERSKKIDAVYGRICAMIRENNGRDVSMDECIALAREALIEFPGNAKLSLALASALYNAGYVRRGEFHIDGPDGYAVYDVERHRTYPEWQEAIKLYEKLLPELQSGELRQKAVTELSQLYKNTGKSEKALQLAQTAPDIEASKPFLRINAFDGRDASAACGEALIETVRLSAELIERITLSDTGTPPRIAAEMVSGAVGMLDLLFTDGFYGRLSGFAACLHMLRSYYLWLAGERSAAFEALDLALVCAKAADGLHESGKEYYTSPLLRNVKLHAVPAGFDIAPELPEVWPWWDVPEYERVKAEMTADPRWEEWAGRTANK